MSLFSQAPSQSTANTGNTSGGGLFGNKPQESGQSTAPNRSTNGLGGSSDVSFKPNTTTTSNTIGNTSSNNASSSDSKTTKSVLGSSTGSNSRLLKDLLESANNLPKLNNHDLGPIHLTLGELQRKSNDLRKTKDDKPNFTRAHYLLASSGMSAEQIENELKSTDAIIANQPSSASGSNTSAYTSATDRVVKPKSLGIDQFLTSRKEENILATIEQSLASASNDFDDYINRTISIDWKARRNNLRKTIDINYDKDMIKSLSNDSVKWNKAVPGNYILAPLNDSHVTSSSRHYTRDKFENYATIIYRLNEARSSNQVFPILSSFEELNKSSGDLKSKQITYVYKILIELTNESKAKVSQEQKFYTKYQTNDPDGTSKLNDLITRKSINYLEQQFYQYLDELYNKDDKKDEYLPPTNINKVTFFINRIIMKNNTEFNDKTLRVNGQPIWAIIYYLLRCGLFNDALHLTLSHREIFDKFDQNFPLYLKKYLENDNFQIPPDLSERLNNEFNQQFSFINDNIDNLYDPYKYAVYKIIGKCDLSKKSLPSTINFSIEDWLWFHLSILSESNNNSGLIFESYKLPSLQKQIIQLGSRKLNASSNNPMYLKCLIMVGLYELAIQYAYDHLSEIDSVHLAIALNYYGLLRVTKSFNKDELIYLNPTCNKYELNFLRLLGSFTRSFRISDPKVACQYLVLIAISKGGDCQEELSKCREALKELLLTSREFNLLLGEINGHNAEKESGLLERQRSLIKLPNLSDFNFKIVESSAKICEEEGRVFDALLLYQSCQEYDTVLLIINKILSELVATTELDKSLIQIGNYENINGEMKAEDTIENNIVLLSQHIIKTFNNNSSILSKITGSFKDTSDLLISVISIREVFRTKNYSKVIHSIESLNLLPVKPNVDLIEIRKLAEYVQNSLDNSILKIIPSLLIIVMTSISQLNYQILTKNFKSLNNENDEISQLKLIAKNCMVFAGMIQYKMPRETYSLLIQLENRL